MIPTTAHPEAYVTFLQDIRFTPPFIFPDGWVASEGYVLIHVAPGEKLRAFLDVTCHEPVDSLFDLMADADAVTDMERTTVRHRLYSPTAWLQALGAHPIDQAPQRLQRAFDEAIPQEVHIALAEGSVYTCVRSGAGKELVA